MSPPLTPDADDARRQLADELSKPIYADVQNWLMEQFRKLMEWLVGNPTSSNSLTSGQLTAITITVVAIALVAVWAVMGPVRADRRRRSAVFADEERSAADLREEAERLAAADNWAGATMGVFRAMVRSLSERAIVEEFPGMTAHEAVGLAVRRLPALAVDLARAADVFDALAYGRRAGSPEQYRAMLALDAEVGRSRPTLAEDAAPERSASVESAR